MSKANAALTQAKWAASGYVSPAKFGIYDPTGVLDSTNAITAAINSGYPVKLGDGNFKITSALPCPSGLKIEGNGMNRTTILPYGQAYAAFTQIGSSASPLHDIEIRDMKIDGTNFSDTTYNTSSKAIFLQYVLRLIITGVWAYNTPATGIGTDFLQSSIIQRCYASYCGRLFQTGDIGANGIGIGSGLLNQSGTGQLETTIIDSCHAWNNGNNGIMWEVQDGSGEQIVGHMRAENCSAWNNGGAGFRNSGNAKMEFVGCTSSFNQDGIVFAEDSLNSGTQLSYESSVTDCMIQSNTRYGINVMYTSGYLKMSDNQIGGNESHGIYSSVALQNSDISDNMIYKNSGYGIYLADGISGTTIHNNKRLADNTGGTIYLGAGASGAEICNNQGYNPVGPISAPTVPAASTAIQNTNGYDCTVIVNGGAGVNIGIGNTSTTTATGLSSGAIPVKAGQYISLGAYTTAPTWVWLGN